MASAEDTIDVTVKYINLLIKHYQIEPADWAIMQRESPEIWRVIDQIEWLGELTHEETQKNCRRLLLNYERMFMRRASGRAKNAA